MSLILPYHLSLCELVDNTAVLALSCYLSPLLLLLTDSLLVIFELHHVHVSSFHLLHLYEIPVVTALSNFLLQLLLFDLLVHELLMECVNLVLTILVQLFNLSNLLVYPALDLFLLSKQVIDA